MEFFIVLNWLINIINPAAAEFYGIAAADTLSYAFLGIAGGFFVPFFRVPAAERSRAMIGRVHSMESMGLVDGPGVRAVVFLQGCSLRCRYCHNPDTWAAGGTEFTPEALTAKLNEIVQLVGKDSLTAADQLTLETAKMLREDFLQQNGFLEVDWYSSYDRQNKMLGMILEYDQRCRAAIAKGASITELFAIPFREKMGRAKTVPDSEYAAVYADMAKEMAQEIDAVAAKGGEDA